MNAPAVADAFIVFCGLLLFTGAGIVVAIWIAVRMFKDWVRDQIDEALCDHVENGHAPPPG